MQSIWTHCYPSTYNIWQHLQLSYCGRLHVFLRSIYASRHCFNIGNIIDTEEQFHSGRFDNKLDCRKRTWPKLTVIKDILCRNCKLFDLIVILAMVIKVILLYATGTTNLHCHLPLALTLSDILNHFSDNLVCCLHSALSIHKY